MFRKYYLRNGLQYYVSGRMVLFVELAAIAGNLFHHGIELLLKYLLLESETFNSDQLRRKFRHDLNKLWMEWKSQQKAPELDQFDELIATLDEWEEIRYPRPGVSIIGYAYRKRSSPPRRTSRSPKEYAINLEAMDELVFVLLDKRVSSDWFHYAISSRTGEGKAQYDRENLHRLF